MVVDLCRGIVRLPLTTHSVVKETTEGITTHRRIPRCVAAVVEIRRRCDLRVT